MSDKVASLLEISDCLDRLGLQKEADLVDHYIRKVAAIPVALDDLPFIARLARIALDMKDLPSDGKATTRVTLPIINKPVRGVAKISVLRAMSKILSMYIREKMYPKQATITNPMDSQEYDDFIDVAEDIQELLAYYGSREEADKSLASALGGIGKTVRKLAGNLERVALSLAHLKDEQTATQEAAALNQQFRELLQPLISALREKNLGKVTSAVETLESSISQALPEEPSGALAQAVTEGPAALSQQEKQRIQRQVLGEKGVLEDLESDENYLNILTKQRTKLRNLLQGPMLHMRKYNQKIKETFLDKPGDAEVGPFIEELKGKITAAMLPRPEDDPDDPDDPDPGLPGWLRAPSGEAGESAAPSGDAEARIGTVLNAFNPKQWTEIQKSTGAKEAEWLRKAIEDNYSLRYTALEEVNVDLQEQNKVIKDKLAEHTPDTKQAEWNYWKRQDVLTPIAAIKAATTALRKGGLDNSGLQEELFGKFKQLLEWERERTSA